MTTLISKLPQMLQKIIYERKSLDIQQFCHQHRNYLVMVFDPKDDTMFASFRGKQISAKMKSADGKNHHVVKNVLKSSTFEREIDRFLGGVMDAIKLPLAAGNSIYQFIDGALFNIANSLNKKDKQYGKTKESGE